MQKINPIINLSIIIILTLFSCTTSSDSSAEASKTAGQETTAVGQLELQVTSFDIVNGDDGDYSIDDLSDNPAETKTASIILGESELIQYNRAGIVKLAYTVENLSGNGLRTTVDNPGITNSPVGSTFLWKVESDPVFPDVLYLTGYLPDDNEMKNPVAVYTCKGSKTSDREVIAGYNKNFKKYYDEHDLSVYSQLSLKQRADLAQSYYDTLGIARIETESGSLERYSVPAHVTPIDELLVITDGNVDDYPVWDRDVLITGSVKSHVPELRIEPGVTVYFGYDDVVEEEDLNGDWADLEIFGNPEFRGTFEKRIHFLSILEHPEAEKYTGKNGGVREYRNEYAPGITVLFFRKDSGKAVVEYCVFRNFTAGGLNIMSEESGPVEVHIRDNLFNLRLGLGSPQFGNISGLVEDNYFMDPEFSTECLDLYDLAEEDTMVIRNNQVGPVFCGDHWGSVMTPIRSRPRAENNVFFMVPYTTKDIYYGDSPYIINNAFIGKFD